MKEDLIGLSLLKEQIIRCGDCNSPLASIILTETNEHREERGLKPLKSKYIINNCYKCGGSSFESETFEGSASIAPYKENNVLEVIDTDIINDVVVSILTMKI
jgi:hypothetical protein